MAVEFGLACCYAQAVFVVSAGGFISAKRISCLTRVSIVDHEVECKVQFPLVAARDCEGFIVHHLGIAVANELFEPASLNSS